jgi:ribosome maturation factor RimP
VDYRRLEVGSPGIDRPLRTRTISCALGQVVDITLKAPIGATGTDVAANRKKFRGTLERAEDGGSGRSSGATNPSPSPASA